MTDVDEAGRYKQELFGNGTTTTRSYFDDKQTLKGVTTTRGAETIQRLSYNWDAQRNLKSRTDTLQAQHTTERFRYDALERLTCAYFGLVENANAACDTSYSYSANGNLTAKSDVGILSYTDAKHPHAVTNVAGGIYAHDAVGNQITRPGGVTIAYTPFDLPKTITQGAKTVSFGYDGDQQRIRKTTSNSETLSFEDVFEQVTTSGVKEFRYSVYSPERVVAIVTRGGNEPGTKYIHVDHLGSTETITKADGTVDEKRSYDAFGQRRNVVWGVAPPASFANSKVKPGFTAHDEQDEFGLVNMRGRLFDPRIGRFTTTDPVIANVYDGQSFGAYAYVHNNPLAFVDPSGFTEQEAWRQWRFEEAPGQLGVHVTFDKLTPPAPRPTPQSLPVADVDVNTMGAGDEGLSQDAPSVDAIPTRPDFWDGVEDGGIDALAGLPSLLPTETTTVIVQIQGTLAVIDAYENGDAIDAVNTANPLMGFATLGFAIDDGDWYTVGRAGVGVGVTIVGAIVGKKVRELLRVSTM